MKNFKNLIIVLVLLLLFTIVGCTSEGDDKVVEEEKLSSFTVTLEKASISLFEGEEASVSVTIGEKENAKFDANQITLTYNQTIIEASIKDDKINIKALSAGNTTVYISYNGINSIYNITIDVLKKLPDPIVDTTAPEIVFTGIEEEMQLSWGKEIDLLEGVSATDNVDGDITSRIKVETDFDNKSYGTYEIKYTVSDEKGNETSKTRKIEVVWDYNIKFIGHAGSFFGAQNSEESCIYALKVLKYQALECDLKRTKDGKFVCCHNEALTATTGKSYTISNFTLQQLQNLKFKEKRGGGSTLVGIADTTYEFKVLTLQRYLEICKEYNAEAIIELKGCNGVSNSDQAGMPALMKLIKDCDMLDHVTFLASAYNTLIWTRNNGYDIPCQYLMNTCDSDTAYQRCVEYKLDISLNVTYGPYIDSFNEKQREQYRENWIKKYQKAGCKVSVWTFTQYCDYKQVQEWIDFGVDYVTCDWQQMDKLNLK